MTTIERVSATPVRIPLEQPLWFSTRHVTSRDFCLVDVEAGGERGRGYIYAGTAGARTVATAVDELLAPILVGADPFDTEALWQRMYQETLLLGRSGAVLRAIAAADIALWDTKGHLLDLPLARMLGSTATTVPAYASGGYYRSGKGLDGLAEEVASWRDRGFRDVKIKVGGAPLREDVERVRVAREALGADGRLALDANNAWHTPADAIRAARAFEPYDIWWLEEPLSPDDIPGHAELAAALEMPVATGEIHANRAEFREILRQRAADIIQADAGVCGGITEWLRIARAAATFGVPVAPHWHADLHVPLVAASENGLTVEYFYLDGDVYNFARLVAEPLHPVDGRLPVPTAPGIGIAWDEAAVQRFTAR